MPFATEQSDLKRLGQFFFSTLFSLQLSYAVVQSDSAVVVAGRVEKSPSLGDILTDETWSHTIPPSGDG